MENVTKPMNFVCRKVLHYWGFTDFFCKTLWILILSDLVDQGRRKTRVVASFKEVTIIDQIDGRKKLVES